MPLDTRPISVLTQFFDQSPSTVASLATLEATTAGALWWASRAVEDREYVLEQ